MKARLTRWQGLLCQLQITGYWRSNYDVMMQKFHRKRLCQTTSSLAQLFTFVPLTPDLIQNEKHFKYNPEYLHGRQLMRYPVRMKYSGNTVTLPKSTQQGCERPLKLPVFALLRPNCGIPLAADNCICVCLEILIPCT